MESIQIALVPHHWLLTFSNYWNEKQRVITHGSLIKYPITIPSTVFFLQLGLEKQWCGKCLHPLGGCQVRKMNKDVPFIFLPHMVLYLYGNEKWTIRIKKAQFISRFKIDYNSIKMDLDSIFCNAEACVHWFCSFQLRIFKVVGTYRKHRETMLHCERCLTPYINKNEIDFLASWLFKVLPFTTQAQNSNFKLSITLWKLFE